MIFSSALPLSRHSFTRAWVEHCIPVIRASGDPCLREGQLMVVHPWPHPGHHHRHELLGRPARGGLRRPPPVLHLLLQRPVVTLLHHPGELQLRTVRRAQAQGQTEPTALLHRGVRRKNVKGRLKNQSERCSHFVKNLSLFSSFPPVHFSVSLLSLWRWSPDTWTNKKKPLFSSNETSCLEDVAKKKKSPVLVFVVKEPMRERTGANPEWIVPLRGC